MATVLVVDDLLADRRLVGGLLERRSGTKVLYAENGASALEQMELHAPDMVITDLVMPNKEGLETISDIRRRGWTMPIVAMTGGGAVGPSSYLKSARLMGADAVLAKPFARGEVLTLLRSFVAAETV